MILAIKITAMSERYRDMFEISIKIHEENDLYNPLDPDCSLHSDDVVSFIIRRYQE